MTATIGVRLMILFAGLIVTAGTMEPQCRSVHVASVKSIFSIAPSPVGANVLFYGSADEAEGEIITGNPFRLRLDGAVNVALQLKAPAASNPSTPVWKRDASSAYFETDSGIYELSSADGGIVPLWKGPSAGLAISPNDLFLAFWRVGRGADILVLYDVAKKSEKRTWSIPDRLERDKTGWDIVFAHDSHALYARTYDEPSRTPLKLFDISSGRVTVMSPDVQALAKGTDEVYYITVSGTNRSLHKIATTTGHSSLVMKDFAYDSLSAGGNPRWLISQDYRTKEIAIVDTETSSITKIGKGESAAMLSDGRLFQAQGGDIEVGDVSCKPK